MLVKIAPEASTVSYTFEPEDGDREAIVSPAGVVKASFRGGSCKYVMPDGWRIEDTHPDLLGAVAVAMACNFTGDSMTLPFPISAHFQQTIKERCKFDIGPLDDQLQSHAAPTDGRPGLCFSAGADSTAALQLMPRDTVSVFLERVTPPDHRSSIYKKDAAVRACNVLAATGREVFRIQTDMEFLREPIGYPNDLSTATPLILLADWASLDSLAFGLIMESSYLNKAYKFREYAQTMHFVRYGGVSEAVGLPWNLITAGLSEVVTTRLVLESPYHHVAQSCIRGDHGAPCLNCWKCFRKSLLDAAIAEEPISSTQLDRYFQIKEALHKLDEVPIKHEDVMMFILQRYQGSNRHMLDLKKVLGVEDVDLRWVERWYTPSREVICESRRAESEAGITARVEPMTDQDIANVKSWDRLAAAEAAGRMAAAE